MVDGYMLEPQVFLFAPSSPSIVSLSHIQEKSFQTKAVLIITSSHTNFPVLAAK